MVFARPLVNMWTCRLYGLSVESNCRLNYLFSRKKEKGEVSFCLKMEREGFAHMEGWLLSERRDSRGNQLFAIFGQGDSYLLRLPGLVDFLISDDGKEVRCFSKNGVSSGLIWDIFSGAVLSVVLSLRGKQILHGSAVAVNRKAIGFLGNSGDGKSTLAASFLRHGYGILNDDLLTLEEEKGEIMVVPGFPSLELWPDSIDQIVGKPDLPTLRPGLDKRLLALKKETFCAHPLPLGALFTLDFTDEQVEVRQLSPHEAFMNLIRSTPLHIRECLSQESFLRRQVATYSEVASQVPMFNLKRPHDLSHLQVTQRLILEELNRLWE